MVRLNFRKSPPHARNTSKTHSEAVDFAGALVVQLASTAWQPEGSNTHQPTRPL
jgi:hypothetical protein